MTTSGMVSFAIDGDLTEAAERGIEVVVSLDNGDRRFCFFMTPESIRMCGDIIPGTDVRLHVGAPQVITVSRLDEAIIRATLESLDATNQLLAHTLPISDAEGPKARTGHCLCRSIEFRLNGPVDSVLHCHCENCRRLTGNFIAAVRTPTTDIDIDDPTALRWHDLGYARYGFCSSCGATLFFVAAETPERTSVTTGTLDDVSDLGLAGVWFANEAQRHNALPIDVPLHAGNG